MVLKLRYVQIYVMVRQAHHDTKNNANKNKKTFSKIQKARAERYWGTAAAVCEKRTWSGNY